MKQAFVLASFIAALLISNPGFGAAQADNTIQSCTLCLEKRYDKDTWLNHHEMKPSQRPRSDSFTKAVELEEKTSGKKPPYSLWAAESAPNTKSAILNENKDLKLFCKFSHIYKDNDDDDEPPIRDRFFWVTDVNFKIYGTFGAFGPEGKKPTFAICLEQGMPKALQENACQLIIDYLDKS